MQEKKTDIQDPEPVRKEKEAHAEDLASKFAIQFFGKELLEYLGIRLKVKIVEPTEFVHLEVRHGYEDFNYMMENGVLPEGGHQYLSDKSNTVKGWECR